MVLRSIKISTLMVSIGLAGVIPFLALTVVVVLGFELFIGREVSFLLTYGAVILSFLGGIIWGQILSSFSLKSEKVGLQKYLLISILPALISWVSLLIEPRFGLILLGICFGCLFFVDKKLKIININPVWYFKLRRILTILVVSSLLLSVVGISLNSQNS